MKRFLSKTGILYFSATIAVIAGWLLVITPLQGSFTDIQATISNEETRRIALEARIVDPQQKERELLAVTEKLTTLDPFYFTDEKALELFTEFERFANLADIDMTFSLAAETGADAESIGIRFNITGAFASTMAFVQSLERMPMVMVMDSIEFMTQGNTTTTTIAARVFTPAQAL
ncbi:MAG: hypothetical protein WCV86_03170 [Patescibacteria group bacterium]|jgi:hypothetical protein